MSSAKQVHDLQRKLTAAERVINDLVREVHELKGTLTKIHETNNPAKPVTYPAQKA